MSGTHIDGLVTEVLKEVALEQKKEEEQARGDGDKLSR